jgi:hypothetical protein
MKHPTRLRPSVLITGLGLGTVLFALTGCSKGAPSAEEITAGVGRRRGACMRDAWFEVEDPDDASVESGVLAAPPGAAQEEFQCAGARRAKDVLEDVG